MILIIYASNCAIDIGTSGHLVENKNQIFNDYPFVQINDNKITLKIQMNCDV